MSQPFHGNESKAITPTGITKVTALCARGTTYHIDVAQLPVIGVYRSTSPDRCRLFKMYKVYINPQKRNNHLHLAEPGCDQQQHSMVPVYRRRYSTSHHSDSQLTLYRRTNLVFLWLGGTQRVGL